MSPRKRREPHPPGPGSRIVGYLRHSDPRQIHSVPQQRKELEQRAEAEGWRIVALFADEGKTGTTDEGRSQFLAMIDFCLDNPPGIDAVVLWEFSRWARNESDFAFYMASLERQGIAVVSMKDPLPEGPAAGIVKAAFAFASAEESRNISRRVKRGQLDALARGHLLGGRVAAGYKAVRQDGMTRWEIDPERAPLVRLAFQMYADGYTIRTVHERTHLFSNVRSYNKFFANPVYIGSFRFGGQEYAGIVEPIVDPDTWARAQERRQTHTHPQTRNSAYRLSGLLRCGHCGRPMKGHTTKSYRYYCCYGYLQQLEAPCPHGYVRAEPLEQAVIDRLLAHLSPENLDAIAAEVAAGQENPARRKLIQAEANIARTERAIANLWAAVEEGSQAARAQLAKREAELAELQERRAALLTEAPPPPKPAPVDRDAVLAALAAARDSLLSEDLADQRAALARHIERVTVAGADVHIYYRPFGLRE